MVDESIFKVGDVCGQSYRIVRLLMRNIWIEKYLVKRGDAEQTSVLTCSRFKHIEGDAPSLELFKANAERIRSAPLNDLPRVYDFGVQHGVYWIVTQYVNAPTIETMHKEARPGTKPDWRALDAAALICTAAGTLSDMVKCGLFHGHLMPGHLVIDGMPFEMNVFLLDAGFAELFQFNAAAARPYLRYCAPEVLEGKAIDERADIYSLGMVFYHLLAQHPPYWDKSKTDLDPALISMVLEKYPTDLRQLGNCPQPLWDLIEQAIQKDPEKRFKSIDDFFVSAQLAINKIEGEPRLVPLPGEAPPTVPPGPDTANKRRTAWLAALQNAALPRVAEETVSREVETPSSAAPQTPEQKKAAIVVAEISGKAQPGDEVEGPATSRSPQGAQERGAQDGDAKTQETKDAPAPPTPDQKPAKGRARGRARLRKAGGWMVLAVVMAGSILGGAYVLGARQMQEQREAAPSQPLVSIEVHTSEAAKENETTRSPACAPTACVMVAPAPCVMCEQQKTSQNVDTPSRRRGKSAPTQEPPKTPQTRTACFNSVMYCMVPQ